MEGVAPPSGEIAGTRGRKPVILTAVVIAVAAVVLVVILVIAGFPRQSTCGSDCRPTMVLSSISRNGAFASAYVASMSFSAGPTNFSLRLIVNGTPTPSAPLAGTGQATYLTLGSDTYTVVWFDATQDSRVSSTDTFTLNAQNGWTRTNTYRFQVLWKDATILASTEWTE